MPAATGGRLGGFRLPGQALAPTTGPSLPAILLVLQVEQVVEGHQAKFVSTGVHAEQAQGGSSVLLTQAGLHPGCSTQHRPQEPQQQPRQESSAGAAGAVPAAAATAGAAATGGELLEALAVGRAGSGAGVLPVPSTQRGMPQEARPTDDDAEFVYGMVRLLEVLFP